MQFISYLMGPIHRSQTAQWLIFAVNLNQDNDLIASDVQLPLIDIYTVF